MKKIRGMNDKVAVLLRDDREESIPTFKEIALNTVANYRPKQTDEVNAAERIKVTNLGLLLLTAKEEWDIEDEYFDILKKILNNSRGYSEFIMGQWSKKINETEISEMNDDKKKGG